MKHMHVNAPADVDVVVPLYNMERYIGEALLSVLEQSLPPQRIIVVDDGSTDGGASIVKALIQQHAGPAHIELVQQVNAGLSAARNTGIKHCTARYVAFLDADDRWKRGKLEAQLAVLARTHHLPALIYCGYRTIDAAGAPVDGAVTVEPALRGRVFNELLLANRISGSGSAVLVRREVLQETGGFDTALQAAEDWDMWLRIADGRDVDFAPEALVDIRRHGTSMQTDTFRMLRNYTAFFVKWLDRGRGHPAVMKQWGHLIAEFALRSADPDLAARTATAMLAPEQRRALFARTLGSLRAYMALKKWRKALGKRAWS